MKLIMLQIVHWFILSYCSSLSGYNLYYTYQLRNGLDKDCLYYHPTERSSVYQLIEYCVRSEFDKYALYNISRHSVFTFEALRQQNISSEELYEWSAPVDLIENYQIYLNNPTVSSNLLFYNCTGPYFGLSCEYSFDQPTMSFAEQVLNRFQIDVYESNKPDVLPCYTHIKCDRTGDHGQTPGACLDWREICDGKIDCVDGGRDEEQCWQLEINECDNETEFRCHNGQCVPRDFLNDDIMHPDCLDESDEKPSYSSFRAIDLEQRYCYTDPRFHCEEHKCYSPLYNIPTVECGDGSCAKRFYIPCNNNRDHMLTEGFIMGINVSTECRDVIICLAGILNYAKATKTRCSMTLHTYAKLTKQFCPPFVKFPPFLFGHVSFIYKNDQLNVSAYSINL